jgi:uncharacterized protein
MLRSTAAPASVEIENAVLEPWPLEEAQIRAGHPEASGLVLWISEDETTMVGVWQCTPGAFDWTHVDETFVIARGRATIEAEGGQRIELAPGVVAFFPNGTKTRWTVHETLRKGFHLHSSQPIRF